MSSNVSTRGTTPDENDATSMPSGAKWTSLASTQPTNLETQKKRRAMLSTLGQTKADEEWYLESFMKQNKSTTMAIACKVFDNTRATYDKWFQLCITRLKKDCIFIRNMASNEAVWRKDEVMHEGRRDDRFNFLLDSDIRRAWYNWVIDGIFTLVATWMKENWSTLSTQKRPRTALSFTLFRKTLEDLVDCDLISTTSKKSEHVLC
ncbi:hypothetical protein FB567DRAFT_587879 [Paraphoma chrysanthemicola]|uniref:Uncharacterized protein n=1 Tax=Paraphoma chrysanthemicola TaxID=798071 RepID=A0A8K0RF39_9PLEO|nr:hypothetical protein FB567DRAFT_587879 [Paraphoma chrysanthemicola]